NKLNIKYAIYYVAELWNKVEEMTIVNCWKKTRILTLLSDTEIDDTTFAIQDLTEVEKDDVDKLIIDLTTNLPDDLTIGHQLNEFNDKNNSQISTKDILDKEQIVNIVLDKQWEFKEGDANDSDVPLPENLALEGLNGLKRFIDFFKQQESRDFNIKDLKVFRRYH
ncbi:25483_t:CDS:1, partial [Dentiscutata erythropus]